MANVKKDRLLRRSYQHHLPLFVISLACVLSLYLTRPYKDVLTRISFATAYPALGLLAITLLIGPWNLLFKRRTPVSTDLRRDVGIWAGILGLIHALVGQNVHLRGRPWLYYVYEHHKNGPSGLRHDVFGFNNFTGLIATFVLIALFATSNDWSLRRLGTPKWKQLQRWNYLCFALSAAHAIGYQTMEKQKAAFIAVAATCIGITLVLQTIGFVIRRQPRVLS
ncbi:MAG: hypothetical protein NVSMB62_06200 [Acidobacteriaceae bacterium]